MVEFMKFINADYLYILISVISDPQTIYPADTAAEKRCNLRARLMAIH